MEVMKRHFVLVHGACHGAWCWYKLTTLLRSGGHRVTALDLSASGIDPKQVLDLQSVSDYSQPLMKFMDSLPTTAEQRVILIAHSLGGLSVSEVMESYPEKISVAVFVTALMHSPELSVSTLLQEVWSNDKYESAEHRAMVNSNRERFSIPFFFNPSHYVIVKPLVELIDEESNPAKYKEYNWGKFTKTKKLSNFKKLDVENIQISHFKISS